MVMTYVPNAKRLPTSKFLLCVLLVLFHLLVSSICSPLADGLQNMSSIHDGHYYADNKTNIQDPSSPVLGGPSLFRYVIRPSYHCKETEDCKSNLPLNCSYEGYCECEPPLCWTYQAKTAFATVDYYFYCGECGELGSECDKLSHQCNYPGYCGLDGFCHCYEGEHQDDICFVRKSSAVWLIFEATFLMCVFLLVAIIFYNTIRSYRRHRTLIWCRIRRRGRSRRRRQGAQPHTTTEKSPAYTTQQLLMQNFHHSDESSLDELTEDETSNDIDQTTVSITKSTDLSPSYENPSCSGTNSNCLQDEQASGSGLQPDTDENSPPSTSSDTSGMTQYCNTHTTSL